jgi:hypothetical protein
MMQVRTPEVRKTIPNLFMCSVKTGNVGDERNAENTKVTWGKGTSKFVRFQAPQLDSFYRDDLRDAPLLPDQTTGSGVVLVVGTVMSSGDLLRLVASNRED